jgi:hypothetical protein
MPEMEIDEQSLFDAAVSDEPVEVEVREVPEAPEPEAQPRDEQGKFAKVEDEPEKPAADAEKPAVDDNAPQVPSWRVREINDEKRALADQVKALEARLQENMRETVKAPLPTEKPTKPDPLLDPEGYEKYLDDKFEAKRVNDIRELDLRLTRQTSAETFDKAYEESQRLKAARDPAFLELSQKMNNTMAPGKVLLDWYQDRTTRAEIGGDLKAYKEKLRKEALEDPEFRKAAMEAWREQAPVNGRSRVDLPPSLNGASRSNALLRSADGSLSDHELFNEITG